MATNNSTLLLATQDSVDAQIREMARQIKAYIDGHTGEIPLIYDPVQFDLKAIYNATNPENLIDWTDNAFEETDNGSIFSQMYNVRRFVFNKLKTVSTNDKCNFLYNCPCLDYISLPALTTLTGTYNYAFNNLPLLTALSLPSLTTLTGNYNYAFSDNAELTRVYLPMLTTVGVNTVVNARLFQACPNLIDIEVGHTDGDLAVGSITDNNLPSRLLRTWSPDNVLADSTKIATMNANIRNHIAANFYDYSSSGGTHTVTFSAAVYAVLETATFAAFTNKGWTVAS